MINYCYKFISILIVLGGTVYIGQFHTAANNVLLVTGVTCSNSATTLTDCTFSHFTKTSTCDAKTITAIKCHCKFIKLKL